MFIFTFFPIILIITNKLKKQHSLFLFYPINSFLLIYEHKKKKKKSPLYEFILKFFLLCKKKKLYFWINSIPLNISFFLLIFITYFLLSFKILFWKNKELKWGGGGRREVIVILFFFLCITCKKKKKRYNFIYLLSIYIYMKEENI